MEIFLVSIEACRVTTCDVTSGVGRRAGVGRVVGSPNVGGTEVSGTDVGRDAEISGRISEVLVVQGLSLGVVGRAVAFEEATLETEG